MADARRDGNKKPPADDSYSEYYEDDDDGSKPAAAKPTTPSGNSIALARQDSSAKALPAAPKSSEDTYEYYDDDNAPAPAAPAATPAARSTLPEYYDEYYDDDIPPAAAAVPATTVRPSAPPPVEAKEAPPVEGRKKGVSFTERSTPPPQDAAPSAAEVLRGAGAATATAITDAGAAVAGGIADTSKRISSLFSDLLPTPPEEQVQQGKAVEMADGTAKADAALLASAAAAGYYSEYEEQEAAAAAGQRAAEQAASAREAERAAQQRVAVSTAGASALERARSSNVSLGGGAHARGNSATQLVVPMVVPWASAPITPAVPMAAPTAVAGRVLPTMATPAPDPNAPAPPVEEDEYSYYDEADPIQPKALPAPSQQQALPAPSTVAKTLTFPRAPATGKTSPEGDQYYDPYDALAANVGLATAGAPPAAPPPPAALGLAKQPSRGALPPGLPPAPPAAGRPAASRPVPDDTFHDATNQSDYYSEDYSPSPAAKTAAAPLTMPPGPLEAATTGLWRLASSFGGAASQPVAAAFPPVVDGSGSADDPRFAPVGGAPALPPGASPSPVRPRATTAGRALASEPAVTPAELRQTLRGLRRTGDAPPTLAAVRETLASLPVLCAGVHARGMGAAAPWWAALLPLHVLVVDGCDDDAAQLSRGVVHDATLAPWAAPRASLACEAGGGAIGLTVDDGHRRFVRTVARVLIELGTPVDATDADGRTALHAACKGGDAAAAISLLELGASTSAVDAAGLTPVQLAEVAAARAQPCPGREAVATATASGAADSSVSRRASRYATLHVVLGAHETHARLLAACTRLAPIAAHAAAHARHDLMHDLRTSAAAEAKAAAGGAPDQQPPPPTSVDVHLLDFVPAVLRTRGGAAGRAFREGFVVTLDAIHFVLAHGRLPAPELVATYLRHRAGSVAELAKLQQLQLNGGGGGGGDGGGEVEEGTAGRALEAASAYLRGGGTVEYALDAVLSAASAVVDVAAAKGDVGAAVVPPSHPLEHFDALHSLLLGDGFVGGPHRPIGAAQAARLWEGPQWHCAAYPISRRTDYDAICRAFPKVVPSAQPQPLAAPVRDDAWLWWEAHNTRPSTLLGEGILRLKPVDDDARWLQVTRDGTPLGNRKVRLEVGGGERWRQAGMFSLICGANRNGKTATTRQVTSISAANEPPPPPLAERADFIVGLRALPRPADGDAANAAAITASTGGALDGRAVKTVASLPKPQPHYSSVYGSEYYEEEPPPPKGTLIDCPPEDHDAARQLGAVWDAHHEKWCVPFTTALEPFAKWLDAPTLAAAAPLHPAADDPYDYYSDEEVSPSTDLLPGDAISLKISGVGLKAMDVVKNKIRGKVASSDPYVKIFGVARKGIPTGSGDDGLERFLLVKTTVKEHELNPIWEQVLLLKPEAGKLAADHEKTGGSVAVVPAAKLVALIAVQFEVWDWDKVIKNEMIGRAELTGGKDPLVRWLRLVGKSDYVPEPKSFANALNDVAPIELHDKKGKHTGTLQMTALLVRLSTKPTGEK